MGLGKRSEVKLDDFRRAAALAVKQASKERCRDVLMALPKEASQDVFSAITEGAVLGSYRFTKYKTGAENDNNWNVEKLNIKDAGDDAIKEGLIFAKAQNFVRDLVNEPGNVINPLSLSNEAKR